MGRFRGHLTHALFILVSEMGISVIFVLLRLSFEEAGDWSRFGFHREEYLKMLLPRVCVQQRMAFLRA